MTDMREALAKIVAKIGAVEPDRSRDDNLRYLLYELDEIGRAALASAPGEPVAWLPMQDGMLITRSKDIAAVWVAAGIEVQPLYTSASVEEVARALSDARVSLAGVITPAMGGDNLAVTLCSYFEPGIESEEMDDFDMWKQGAVDAMNAALDAIHAHYAAAISNMGK